MKPRFAATILAFVSAQAADKSVWSQTPPQNYRLDYVGKATSGLATIQVGNDASANPAVKQAIFYVRSDDGNCVPTEVTKCRFTIELITINLGGFSLGDTHFDSMEVRNREPVSIEVGGAAINLPFLPPVIAPGVFPDETRVNVFVRSDGNLSHTIFESPSVIFSVSPVNKGRLFLAGSFQGTIKNRTVSAVFQIAANTPLLNRPPVAVAGPDQQLEISNCEGSSISLDASGTTDPENNIASYQWKLDQFTIATGETATVPDVPPGVYPITMLVTDSFGGVSRDDLKVKVIVSVRPEKCVRPLISCVAKGERGEKIAHLGYVNALSWAVEIPVGPSNTFSPAPMDRGQPTTFLPGRHESVFSLSFHGENLWLLGEEEIRFLPNAHLACTFPPRSPNSQKP